MVAALRAQVPARDRPGVSIEKVQEKLKFPFDISFELRSGRNRIQVLAEAKQTFSPRIIAEIAPWIRRLKSLRPDLAGALMAPALSEQAQEFCIENRIDSLDLAGNISINVPGKFYFAADRRGGALSARSEERIAAHHEPIFRSLLTRPARAARKSQAVDAHRDWTGVGGREQAIRESVSHPPPAPTL